MYQPIADGAIPGLDPLRNRLNKPWWANQSAAHLHSLFISSCQPLPCLTCCPDFLWSWRVMYKCKQNKPFPLQFRLPMVFQYSNRNPKTRLDILFTDCPSVMFITALVTIDKKRKCPSIDECIMKIYIIHIHFSCKEKMKFEGKWISHKFILSELTQN